jgi:uncharacterized protein YndB with AHSA1/START domain
MFGRIRKGYTYISKNYSRILFILNLNVMQTKSKTTHDTQIPNEIEICRVFKLPVNKVWKALTEPEYFKKWYGPEGFTCPYSSMEAKKGGKYLNCMKSPDGKEFWSTGVVKEFVPEKKLVLTDSFSDNKGNVISASEYGLPGDWPRELTITYELDEADGATKLYLRHDGIPEDAHDDCVEGWNQSLDKLEKNIK